MSDNLRKIFAVALVIGIILTGGFLISFLKPDFEKESKQIGAVCLVLNEVDLITTLKSISPEQKGGRIGLEMAKMRCMPKTRTTKHWDGYIEMTNIKKINEGVEVLVRAWDKDNRQIGFGHDGSVDLERFILVNPPIKVWDGTMRNETLDAGTPRERVVQLQNFKEDLYAALIDRVSLGLSMKSQKRVSNNIEGGKIGNTTLTVSPNAGTGTAPIDGWMGHVEGSPGGVSFATIRGGAGTTHNDTQTANSCGSLSAGTTDSSYISMRRAGHGFNTSAIGSETINSASLALFISEKPIGLGNTNGDLTSFTPTDGADFANGDYAVANFGSTRWATGQSITAMTVGSQTTWTFNSDGINGINKTGNTFIGARLLWDVDGSFGGTWVSDVETAFGCYYADDATNDPVLTVDYGAAGYQDISVIIEE